ITIINISGYSTGNNLENHVLGKNIPLPGRTRIPGSLVNGFPGSPSEGTLGSIPGPYSLPENGKLPTRRTFHISEYGREGSNLSYVTMAVDEQDIASEFTPREADLQRQIDGLQSQVIDLHKARETTENPELSSEVQILKEKLGEHSKQLELSTEKLNQLQTENAALRDQNKAPNTASNKKCRFNSQVRPRGSLSTPNTGEGTTNVTFASGAAGATREGIEDHRIQDLQE
ncbi:hypothetical protein HID58_034085, partial [Brassica napus]